METTALRLLLYIIALAHCFSRLTLIFFHFQFSFPLHLVCVYKQHHRHRSNQHVLRDMIPDYMYQYCAQHNLLDPIIGNNSCSATTGTTTAAIAAGKTGVGEPPPVWL